MLFVALVTLKIKPKLREDGLRKNNRDTALICALKNRDIEYSRTRSKYFRYMPKRLGVLTSVSFRVAQSHCLSKRLFSGFQLLLVFFGESLHHPFVGVTSEVSQHLIRQFSRERYGYPVFFVHVISWDN